MDKLIEQYKERFDENFPLFAFMGVDETEVKAIIQKAIDDGVPYHPPEEDSQIVY